MTKAFGADTTAEEVLDGVDLSGKRILVTGVSAGLGAELARLLRARGADVVGAARDLAKAKAATDGAPGPGRLDLVTLDLASLASVRACADRLLAAGQPFDVVFANAGVMGCAQGETADGFETHFGVNHLGHFVFVNRIAPLLRPRARVVALTSWGHAYADVDLADPNFARTAYDPMAAYGRSKTANILFAVEFDRRHQAAGVRATAVHPGGIHTELYRHMDPTIVSYLTTPPEAGAPAILGKTVAQGVAPAVWAGLIAAPDAVGGRYCEDCHVAERVDTDGSMFGVRGYAIDPRRARDLWAKSEEMVGERF